MPNGLDSVDPEAGLDELLLALVIILGASAGAMAPLLTRKRHQIICGGDILSQTTLLAILT